MGAQLSPSLVIDFSANPNEAARQLLELIEGLQK
jgi:hypothetical protein